MDERPHLVPAAIKITTAVLNSLAARVQRPQRIKHVVLVLAEGDLVMERSTDHPCLIDHIGHAGG